MVKLEDFKHREVHSETFKMLSPSVTIVDLEATSKSAKRTCFNKLRERIPVEFVSSIKTNIEVDGQIVTVYCVYKPLVNGDVLYGTNE